MKFVFLLRHYNDVDHIAPIIWKSLQRGHEATVVMGNPLYDVSSDPRLSLIRKTENCDFSYIHEFLGIPWSHHPFRIDAEGVKDTTFDAFRWALRKSGWSLARAREELSDTDVCIFEWGEPSARPRVELFEAASDLDVPTVAFPHGLNIYLNIDMNAFRKEALAKGAIDRSTKNSFDSYVFQSEYDKDQLVQLGMDEETVEVMGSSRYCPEWEAINREFYDPFEPEGFVGDRLKVVFMLPHWEYNVDKPKTLALIEEMAAGDMFLVAKDHTRGNGSLSVRQKERLVQYQGFEAVVEPPSTSLIEWADAVVNFGSSIGIEALAMDTMLINPSYLHTNETIFEATGACIETSSNEETVQTLHDISDDNVEEIPEQCIENLYRRVVYGGRDPHNVLAAHVDFLERHANES